MQRISLLGIFLFLGCQSAPLSRRALLEDRVTKLKPLGQKAPMRCLMLVQLTEPARARYQRMFQGELLDSRAMTFTYRVSPETCGVIPLEPGIVAEREKSILQTALCVIVQTHFIHSPFEGLHPAESDLETEAETGRVHIRQGTGDLGLYLDPKAVALETRTRARGDFLATYSDRAGRWLPDFIEHRMGASKIRLDHFVFAAFRNQSPAWMRGFDLSLGSAAEGPDPNAVIKHALVELADCQLNER